MKGNSNGSKFLPGGGKGGNANQSSQRIKNQAQRTMHTNQSHMGGSHGK